MLRERFVYERLANILAQDNVHESSAWDVVDILGFLGRLHVFKVGDLGVFLHTS